MSFFLCIETSGKTASVAIVQKGACVAQEINVQLNEHAAFLQPAIQKMLQYADLSIADLDAVSVSIGPGSYTGLRVGLASAKGICFALQKPLITINTLTIMAYAAREQLIRDSIQCDYLVPMIDARRNEVFTAAYDLNLNFVIEPQPLILNEDSYNDLMHGSINFFGDGATKWRPQCSLSKAIFSDIHVTASMMSVLTEQAFNKKNFAPLHSTIPYYGKEFYTTAVRN
ncbi:MAG: tRNA (adenosine(37)-N6)-threonylcarbamoyltransferase complex dimerization subunit type 1 TsaB [Bacteroidota bacterium]